MTCHVSIILQLILIILNLHCVFTIEQHYYGKLAPTLGVNTSQPVYYMPIVSSKVTPTIDLFRFKKRFDKLLTHHGQSYQMLNELFADFLSKTFANTTLEQLISEKVKRPRTIQLLTGTFGNVNDTGETNIQRTSPVEPQVGDGLIWSKSKNPITGVGNPLGNFMGRCYEPYGCFRITEPFRIIYRPINLIPEPPAAIKVSFHLRTRANPSIAERLVYSEISEFLLSKYFRPTVPVKLIVHGYLESVMEPWIQVMDAIFQQTIMTLLL